MIETRDEELSIKDNLFINAPMYFKLFGWGKHFLKTQVHL